MGTEERRSDGDADDPGECEDLESKLFNLAHSTFNEGSKSSRDQHCTSKAMRRGKMHETSHISRGDIVYNVNNKCDYFRQAHTTRPTYNVYLIERGIIKTAQNPEIRVPTPYPTRQPKHFQKTLTAHSGTRATTTQLSNTQAIVCNTTRTLAQPPPTNNSTKFLSNHPCCHPIPSLLHRAIGPSQPHACILPQDRAGSIIISNTTNSSSQATKITMA
jgi:hypothetical protein